MPKSDFLKRFDIPVSNDVARQQFLNRISNHVFENFFQQDIEEHYLQETILWHVAHELGEKYSSLKSFHSYTGGQFSPTLHALEVAFRHLKTRKQKKELTRLIEFVLSSSELDLGIRWSNGKFVPQRARELDQALVDDNLKWLSDPKYASVLRPFEKALKAFLTLDNKPEHATDIIRDLYEAIESLAKIVTGRDTGDLSANIEQLLTQLKVSSGFREVLRSYTKYANPFRHGTGKRGPSRRVSLHEVESFLYFTGLLIRLSRLSAAA